MNKAQSSHNLLADNVLLAPLYHKIEQKHGKRKTEHLKLFARQYFASSSQSELSKLPVSQLYNEVICSWEFLQSRTDSGAKISFNHSHTGIRSDGSHGSALYILTDDMPFLVDSLSQELNRQGFSINAVFNVVVQVERNQQVNGQRGKLKQLSIGSGLRTEEYPEALICIHIGLLFADEAKKLEADIREVLEAVEVAVHDYAQMCKQILAVSEALNKENVPVSHEEVAESQEFIQWLIENHFTFLGYEQYRLTGKGKNKRIRLQTNTLLGVSRLKTSLKSSMLLSKVPQQAGKLITRKQVCDFAKSALRSKVHRPAYYDYLLIKEFDDNGEVCTEHRFLGLYTSAVYFQSVSEIPLVRKKVDHVLGKSGFSSNGHSIKSLYQVINVFPRDELFQISEAQLFDTAMQILQIQERRRIRLFIRRDSYGQFFSCLIYIPRDIFRTRVRLEVQDFLTRELQAEELDFSTYYSESILVRVHLILRVPQIDKVKFDIADLESRLVARITPWIDYFQEQLVQRVGEREALLQVRKHASNLPASYMEEYSPETAIDDLPHIEKAIKQKGLALDFKTTCRDENCSFDFKIYSYKNQLLLSDVIPTLENMGMRVLRERGYRLQQEDGEIVWMHDFSLTSQLSNTVDAEQSKQNFEETFLAIYKGETEDDAFNTLVLSSQLNWREVALLRAYAAYMKQIKSGYGQQFIADTLSRHGIVTSLLVKFFFASFDPAMQKENIDAQTKIRRWINRIAKAVDRIDNLAEDKVLRLYLRLFAATRRSNYFQPAEDGKFKSYFSFKLLPEKVPEIPRPRPQFEIFVYSPEMEGVHLRGGKVARGGLRWSDRHEDFRTEVLGLVKAQQVKNSVIVPVGAKGGFVVKKSTNGLTREEIQKQGIACYKTFIRGLLDLTDNIESGRVVPPPDIVRRDDDDTYLVVAADKGTAAFSDIANSVAKEYDFWLGDGFASGGSQGYDHKKMGITARGAWVSVQRHFRELGVNVQKEEFTVLGIGDMSGDVFGNGMLLSRHIRLVAAFNHLNIFVDPDPDASRTFKERRRLFKLSRSSWTDFDPELISNGGGVFSRSAKSITISKEMKTCFGIEENQLTPDALISALLKSPVDLLWNGGIGTYVKASHEDNNNIGDKANDGLRVDANTLRCKVIGEGGNLGLTQAGRVEYALHGGLCYTDFIDNSAGVDCSDHEVNIKILLNSAVQHNNLDGEQRDQLLTEMTDSVSELVLDNNYRQVQTIGLAFSQMQSRVQEFMDMLGFLERNAGLDRQLEFIPMDDELDERIEDGQGLSRPELSVMTSYIKMYLKSQLATVSYIDQQFLLPYLYSAFPNVLLDKYRSELHAHHLRREIIATQLANTVVNLTGPGFVSGMSDSSGLAVSEIVKAVVIARAILDIDECWTAIEQLDYKIDSTIQAGMMLRLVRVMRNVSRWLLRDHDATLDFEQTVWHLSDSLTELKSSLPASLPGPLHDNWNEDVATLKKRGASASLARELANSEYLPALLAVIDIATRSKTPLADVLEIYYAVDTRIGFTTLRDMMQNLKVTNSWEELARDAFRDDLNWQQQTLTENVIRVMPQGSSASGAVKSWCEKNERLINRSQWMIRELQKQGGAEYPMYSVVLRELLEVVESTILEDGTGEKSQKA